MLPAVVSFSQIRYIYTARKSGRWDDPNNWTITVRTDGVDKNKVIIPASFNIVTDGTFNSPGLGDVDIQISGGLTLLPNTIISLTNNSTVSILNSGGINGSATNQQIKIGSVIKYDGSVDKTKKGQSIADNMSSASPNGFRALSVLVGNFLQFSATLTSNGIVQIQWKNSNETTSTRYEIEKSIDAQSWEVVAVVAVDPCPALSHSYEYKEPVSSAISRYYFRIKQIEVGGISAYSKVKIVSCASTSTASIFVSAANTITTVLNKTSTNPVSVRVIDMSGTVIARQDFPGQTTTLLLRVNNGRPGIYFVEATDGSAFRTTQKVML
jgi:hypothetical protein